MGRYLAKRLLIAVPSLFGISIILFTVLSLLGGGRHGPALEQQPMTAFALGLRRLPHRRDALDGAAVRQTT